MGNFNNKVGNVILISKYYGEKNSTLIKFVVWLRVNNPITGNLCLLYF